jgi:TrpR-related protein YerC/YecD
MDEESHSAPLSFLYKSLAEIKDEKDMKNLLLDLCTPQERQAMAERLHVAKLLHEKKLSYRAIYAQTGVSLATITRVARFLKDESYGGYRRLFCVSIKE